jgi:hypothetical protein
MHDYVTTVTTTEDGIVDFVDLILGEEHAYSLAST